jgi:putative NADH-flavin reductase
MKAMKNILLLGATGKTGREVLHYALSKEYHITALVRDPGKTDIASGLLTLVKGTPVKIDDLRALDGYEAVISTLGHTNLDPSTLMTDSISNMTLVMNEKGIRRIVVQTGAGAGDSFSRMPMSIQQVIRDSDLKTVYGDHNSQENVLMHTGLDWTVVRPVTLNDGEEGTALIKQDRISESCSISRKTVAKFLVDCLEKVELFGKALVISEEN